MKIMMKNFKTICTCERKFEQNGQEKTSV